MRRSPDVTVNGVTGKLQGVPIVNDPQPFYGSQFDTTVGQPRAARAKGKESYANGNIAANLTFASMPLTFAGKGIAADMAQDRGPEADLADIQQDIPFIADRTAACR